MRVNIVNSANSINIKKNPPLNFTQTISFKSNPVFHSFDSEMEKYSITELIEEYNGILEQLKSEIQIHNEKTKEIRQKVFDIESGFDASHKGKTKTFEEFRKALFAKLSPVRQAFEEFEKNCYVRRQLGIGLGEDPKNGFMGGYALFSSKDKQLGDDMASLYSFFSKARWSQERAKNDAYDFSDTYSKGYLFNGQELSTLDKLKNAPRDEKFCAFMQDTLLEMLEENTVSHDVNKRPFFLVVNDLQALIDENCNSESNIAGMRLLLCESVEDNKTIILAGAQNPLPDSINKGTIQVNRLIAITNLDELKVNRGLVDLLQEYKTDLGDAVDEIEQVYKTLAQEDKDRIRGIDKLFRRYTAAYRALLERGCPDKAAQEAFEKDFLAEYFAVSKGEPVESCLKRNPSYLSLIKKELIAASGDSFTSSSNVKETLVQAGENISKSNKMGKLVVATIAFCSAAVGFFAYRKQSKNKIQAPESPKPQITTAIPNQFLKFPN